MAKRGFTLIELLVVIAIIGILATLTLNSLGGTRAKARDSVRKNDLAQVRTALEMYSGENGIYPASTGDSWSGSSSYPTPFTASLNGVKPFYPNYLTVQVKPPVATDSYYYRTNGGSYDIAGTCTNGNLAFGTTPANSQYVLEAKLEAPTMAAPSAGFVIWQVKSTGSSAEASSANKCTAIN